MKITDARRPGKIPGANGGTLNAGGTPGNSGGKPGRSGRPPQWLRDRAFDLFWELLPVLEAIADDTGARARDRIRAVDVLGKYGAGSLQGISVDDVQERMEATMEVIRRRTAPEQFAAISDAVARVWR